MPKLLFSETTPGGRELQEEKVVDFESRWNSALQEAAGEVAKAEAGMVVTNTSKKY